MRICERIGNRNVERQERNDRKEQKRRTIVELRTAHAPNTLTSKGNERLYDVK